MLKFLVILTIMELSLCFVLNNSAGAEQTLAWEECVREAKENHPDLISAEERLNQAKANYVITTSSRLPQISSSLSGRTSKTSGQDTRDTYSYTITGKQLLFDGFKTSQNIGAALENIEAAQYNYEVTSSNIRLRLRAACRNLSFGRRHRHYEYYACLCY